MGGAAPGVLVGRGADVNLGAGEAELSGELEGQARCEARQGGRAPGHDHVEAQFLKENEKEIEGPVTEPRRCHQTKPGSQGDTRL